MEKSGKSNHIMNEPIKISFSNLTYTVRVKTTAEERKEGAGKMKDFDVLKNVTGFANPAETLYIMGASGAGKTSLMNVLSDRISVGKNKRLSGSILLNDQIPLK